MASKEVYTNDKELENLYNSLEKGSLVRLLIEKHRQLEKQVLNLPVVIRQSEQLSECEHPFDRISGYKVGLPYCNKCRKSL